jgi:hypothetical protein
MLCASDHSGLIKNFTISLNLFVESAKGIFVTLNLVPGEVAVDNSNVSSAFAMFKPQFVYNKSIGVCMVLMQSFPMKALTDLSVIHDSL